MIIEDGTGKPEANSYQSVATAEAFLNEQGFTAFSSLATEEEKEAKLIRACRSVDASASLARWGDPLNPEQGLFYPRQTWWWWSTSGITGISTEVPEEIIHAQAYKAEALTLLDADPVSGIPAGVTEMEWAKGVRVKFGTDGASAGGDRLAKEVQAQVTSALQRLRPELVT